MNEFNYVDFFIFHREISDFYNETIKNAAKRCGVTKQEADMLLFIYKNENCDFETDVVKYRNFSKEDAYESVKQLELHNLIEILRDDNSSIKCIKINGKGGIIAKSLEGVEKRFFSNLLKTITNDEQNCLLSIMQKMSIIIEKICEFCRLK